jgi:hypothetical protein
MISALNIPAVLLAVTVTTLIGIYIWSKDSDLRNRAWQILSLIMNRHPSDDGRAPADDDVA